MHKEFDSVMLVLRHRLFKHKLHSTTGAHGTGQDGANIRLDIDCTFNALQSAMVKVL